MPSLNSSQFRSLNIEQTIAHKNLEDPTSPHRGFQQYSSNLYAPSFSGEYNAPPEPNRSTASADTEEDEEY